MVMLMEQFFLFLLLFFIQPRFLLPGNGFLEVKAMEIIWLTAGFFSVHLILISASVEVKVTSCERPEDSVELLWCAKDNQCVYLSMLILAFLALWYMLKTMESRFSRKCWSSHHSTLDQDALYIYHVLGVYISPFKNNFNNYFLL